MKIVRKYVVVRNGVNKDGEPYSKLCLIKKGTSKDTQAPYEYIDDKVVEYVDGEMLPVGKIIEMESVLKEAGK